MIGLTIDTELVDWVELDKQKEALVETIVALQDIGDLDRAETLNGIVHFLDYIQDSAALILGAKNVFPEPDDNYLTAENPLDQEPF